MYLPLLKSSAVFRFPQTLILKVQPSDYVSDLKSLVSQKEYIKPSEQTLYFGTKPLKDDQTLQTYNIADTPTIHLNIRLRGGSEMKVHPKAPKAPYMPLKNDEFFSLQGVIEDVKKRENLLPKGSEDLQELKKKFLSGCEARVKFEENGGITEVPLDSKIIWLTLLNPSQENARKMGISGSGKYLAYADKDGTLKVLDLAAKQEIGIQAKTEANTHEMRAILFSADDNYILTGSDDGKVKCYDFTTRQEIFVFENEPHHKGSSPFKSLKPVKVLALSHDNKYFVLASDDDSIKIVHRESREVYHSFPDAHKWNDNNATVKSIWITQDNNYFVSAADDGTVKIWDLQRKQEIHQFTDAIAGSLGGLASVCVSEDSRYMVHTRRHHIRLYDFQLRKVIHTFEKIHTREIEVVMITQANKYIISVCTHGSISIYDLETKQQILWQEQIGGTFNPSSAIAQNGKLAAISGDSVIKLVNLESPDQANHFIKPHTDLPNGFAFSHDNNYLVTIFWDGSIKVFDLVDHKEVAFIEKAHKDFVAAVAISHDDKYMVTSGFDRQMKIYNFEQRQEIESIPNTSSSGCYITSLFFSRDSKWLVTGTNDGFIKVLDFQTKQEMFSYQSKLGEKFLIDQQKMLAFSRSNKYIASPTGDLDILVYDTENRKVHCEIKQAHQKKIRSLQISSDDKYVISASNDRCIKVFSIQTQELVHNFENIHESQVSSIILSHDARFLISASDDCSLRVFDLTTKKQLHQLNKIHIGQSPLLTFSSDSSLFAFRGKDDSIQVYKLPFSNPDWVYPISSKIPFYSAIGKYEKLILDVPQDTNRIVNLKAYQDLCFVPYNWTVLHLLAVYEPSEISKIPSYPEIQVPTLVDIYNKTPLQYLLAQDNIDYSSINNMLKYILDYIEDSDNRTFAEKTAIISSISPLLPFILSKTSANLVNRFLKLCFDQPSTVHSETFPRFGQNTNKYCLANAPILNSDIKKEIYNYGQAQITFSASFLHYDYDPLSNDMLKSIITLQEVEDEDVFRYRAISSMIDHLWRTSWFFHSFMGLLFAIHITLMSVYIGLGNRNLGMAIVILALSGFFLVSEALQCYILKLKYLSTLWNWSDLIYHAIVIGTIAAGLDDNYTRLSRGWLYSTIIIVGYVRLVSYLRLFRLTRNLIRTIIAIVIDIRGFVLILFLIILGFSLIFLEFDRGFNYLDHFYATYQILYGNADYDDYSPSQKILLGIILFFISIVLLNILIAMMGDSYEKVQSKQVLTDSHTKLEMILESTILMRMFFPKRQSKKGYLMFCEPRSVGDDDTAGNEWEGRINVLKKLFKQNDENVASLREDVKAIENNVKNLEKKMDGNYRSILLALQSLQK